MIVALILIIAAVILFGGSWYAYRIAFFSPAEGRDRIPSTSGPQYDPYRPRMKEMYENLMARPFEYVTIKSNDGLTLSGRYYHVKDGAPLDICFHGYRSSPLTDFSGGSELSLAMEHNLLLVDQRAHGKSEGKTISFGIKERWDVLSWVDYAIDRFGGEIQIILYGISMGGATVLIASELELPSNVKGIVADCPYARAEDIIVDVGRKMHFPPVFTIPFARLGARIFGGFDLNETDAVRSVQHAKVPILIIHGEADGFVPVEMSEAVQSANPQMVHRITFPVADHGICYLSDTPRYSQAVREFSQEVLA